jgi:hypothetical protein
MSLTAAGFTLASPRNNSVHVMVEYGCGAISLVCLGDAPKYWKACKRGEPGDDADWCAHACGDLCKHPDAVAIIPAGLTSTGLLGDEHPRKEITCRR